jgi:hypothetical protein
MSAAAQLDATLLRLALRDALKAPSAHNVQPWRFTVRGASVELWADPTRRLPVVDPDDRELTISCGAALGFLQISLLRYGYEPHVELLLDGARLARISLGPPHVPTDRTKELAAAIDRCHANRGPFATEPVPIPVLVELRDTAEAEHAFLTVVGDRLHRERLAALIAEADRIQWHDPAFRREASPSLLHRTFDRGDGIAARDREIAEHAPALAVLSTMHDQPFDWLMAGQALARVLLTNTRHGLSASFLNQAIEVPSIRGYVRDLLGLAQPQLVLRIGRALQEAHDAPCRPLEDVLF